VPALGFFAERRFCAWSFGRAWLGTSGWQAVVRAANGKGCRLVSCKASRRYQVRASEPRSTAVSAGRDRPSLPERGVRPPFVPEGSQSQEDAAGGELGALASPGGRGQDSPAGLP